MKIDLEAERLEILKRYRKLLRTAKPYLKDDDARYLFDLDYDVDEDEVEFDFNFIEEEEDDDDDYLQKFNQAGF